jgi:hypothetical protein
LQIGANEASAQGTTDLTENHFRSFFLFWGESKTCFPGYKWKWFRTTNMEADFGEMFSPSIAVGALAMLPSNKFGAHETFHDWSISLYIDAFVVPSVSRAFLWAFLERF